MLLNCRFSSKSTIASSTRFQAFQGTPQFSWETLQKAFHQTPKNFSSDTPKTVFGSLLVIPPGLQRRIPDL